MISVNIISGFLGAGKTTFINRLCKALRSFGEISVIIENEYGAESVDSELLSATGSEIIDLSQGCICCNLKNGLEDALTQIAEKENPDRVIIEPSGIFILSEIFGILNEPELKKQYQIASIVTLVDAQIFLRCKGKYGLFIENQIKFSSRLILTKHKNLPAEQLDEIVSEIKKINGDAKIIFDNIFEMNDEEIMDLAQSMPIAEPSEYVRTGHAPLKSVTLYPQKAFDIKLLENITEGIKSGKYGDIFRLKGFLKSSMGDGEFFKIQYTGGRHTISSTTMPLKPMLNIIGEKPNREALTSDFNM